MSHLFWWANVCLAVVTLMAYASPYVPPTTLWPFAFAGLGFPTFVLLHVGFIAWYVFRKSHRAWLSVVTLVIGYSALLEFVGFGGSPKPEDAALDERLTLVNYNLLGGRALYADAPEAFRQNFREFSSCVLEGVDVVAFQETPSYKKVRAGLTEALDAEGIKHHFYAKGMVLSMHARYPLLETEIVDNFNDYNGVLTALIVPSPGDTLRVFAVHLQSNSVRLNAGALIREAAKSERKAYWRVRTVACQLPGRGPGARAAGRQTHRRHRGKRVPGAGDGGLQRHAHVLRRRRDPARGPRRQFSRKRQWTGRELPGDDPGSADRLPDGE